MIVHLAFFRHTDRTSYREQNYRTNTIIIIHLATLSTTVFHSSLLLICLWLLRKARLYRGGALRWTGNLPRVYPASRP
ncbi:hypothetical protein AMECASPLE_026600 [Ameca splendens]|uniref:Uncharacterized protein n=1 Tax=Ameca splendens TaxID=208324 RepID=A0ABV0YSK7_9TELE